MNKKNWLILSFLLIFVACSNNQPKNIEKNKETNIETSVETIIETKESIVETKESIIETKEDNSNSKIETVETDNSKTDKIDSTKNHNSLEKNVFKASEVKEFIDGDKKTNKKIVFLTFDDGPNNEITPKILDVLKQKDVRATFFVVGKNISDDTASVLKRMYDEGNSIATHSYSHDYDKLYPNGNADIDAIIEEQNSTINKIKKYLGKDFNSCVFRYPGGHMSWNRKAIKKADKALREIGVEWIDWNSMNGDAQPSNMPENDISRPKNIDDVINNFEKSKTFISNDNVLVVLMHDSSDKELTLKALPALIDHIKSQGYEFGIIE